MGAVDLILNLAGLLLWVNWVLVAVSPKAGTPTTLLGTLRPAEPAKWRQRSLVATLPALLIIRAWVYWEIASSTHWTPPLNLGVLVIAFRCDLFQRAFVYSVLSFGAMLTLFYLWLLLLSVVNRRAPTPDPVGRFIRMMLGPVGGLPAWLKLVLPLIAGTLLWLPLSVLLTWMDLLPPPDSLLHRLEQGLLIAGSACLTWSHLLAGVLLVFLVNSYVHLGVHPLWSFAHSVGTTVLTPFRRLPLVMGRLDFAPLVVLCLMYLVARGGEHLLLLASQILPW